MNCPKCGYSQEERLDCRKCGVVFSKFYALHTTSKPTILEVADPIRPSSAGENYQAEIADLRQTLKDLSQRFNELEFERAERTQLRSEVRQIDSKLKDTLAQVSERMSALEEKSAAPPPPAVSQEDLNRMQQELREECFAPLGERMRQVEDRFGSLQIRNEAGTDPLVGDSILKLEQRVTALDEEINRLASSPASNPESPDPASGTGQGEIEGLRESLQTVTMRYSEIGELKKNHLILQSNMESLQLQLEQAKKTPERNGSGRITELETEITALRAELRQALVRMEAVEATGPSTAVELGALKAELAGLKKMNAEQIGRTQAGLDARLQKELDRLSALPSLLKRLEALEMAAPDAALEFGAIKAELSGFKKASAEQNEQKRAALDDAVRKAVEPLTGLGEAVARLEQRQLALEKIFEELARIGEMEAQKAIDRDKELTSVRSDIAVLHDEVGSTGKKLEAVLSRPVENPRLPLEEEIHAIRTALEELRHYFNSPH